MSLILNRRSKQSYDGNCVRFEIGSDQRLIASSVLGKTSETWDYRSHSAPDGTVMMHMKVK